MQHLILTLLFSHKYDPHSLAYTQLDYSHDPMSTTCPEACRQPFNLAIIVCWLTTAVCQKYHMWLMVQYASNPTAPSSSSSSSLSNPPGQSFQQHNQQVILEACQNHHTVTSYGEVVVMVLMDVP